MLAIGLELLGGRYAATAYNNRNEAEWPPHPARLFSALVATWQEGEADTEAGQREREALRFLERLAAPQIFGSAPTDLARRDVVPVFVPVNDAATVRPPSRDRLDEAEAALAAASSADSKGRDKLVKQVDKARDKLNADTARAIAAHDNDVGFGVRVLPEGRGKQPRTFPSVTPAHPAVAFVWPDDVLPDSLHAPLRDLLARLVRVGHSSSQVAARLLDPGALTDLARSTICFVPDEEDGEHMVRWVGAGQLERLDQAFDLHRESEPRVLPARFVRYAEGARSQRLRPSEGVFAADSMVIFARVGGPRLPITSTLGVARQFRRALLAAAGDGAPALLSGHSAEGGPSEAPHLAIVPLPLVGGAHADGTILGLGLIFPRECDARERRSAMAAIGRLEQAGVGPDDDVPVIPLRLGDAGVLELQRVAWGEDHRSTLQAGRWCRPARAWASATPVALDRNPGDLNDADTGRRTAAFAAARETIRLAIERVGYPEPLEIDVVRSAVVPGSAKPRSFPRFPVEAARPQRVLVHTRIVFPAPVRGPMLLGAGRYFGLGLHTPIDPSARMEGLP